MEDRQFILKDIQSAGIDNYTIEMCIKVKVHYIFLHLYVCLKTEENLRKSAVFH